MYIDTPPPSYIASLPPYVVPEAVFLGCSLAYLVASFPDGFLFVALRLVEPDAEKTGGMRNLEAEDMLRAGKRLLAVVTFLLDLVKGPFAIFTGIACGALFIKDNLALDDRHHVCIPELSLYMLFLPPVAALLGHVFPVWLQFRGGKGFANALGIYFLLNPVVGAITALTALGIFLATRLSPLAAVVSMALSPLWGWVFARYVWLEQPDVTWHFACMALVVALIVIGRHKDGRVQMLLLWRRAKQ
jgi:glycerol-3-phosphate acyltransferase PlsY